MKTIVKTSILLALLFALTSTAYSTGIPVGSYGTGQDAMGNANTALVYQGYSAALLAPVGSLPAPPPTSTTSYNVLPYDVWDPALPQSSWVSNDPNAGPYGSVTDPNGYYYYTSTFTASGGILAGTIGVSADDTAAIYINNQLIVDFANMGSGSNDNHCQSNEPNCNAVEWISFDSGLLNSGTNTILVIDDQTGGGPAGVDFQGVITPEPSSLFLLGTGLFGLAMLLFRKSAMPSSTLP